MTVKTTLSFTDRHHRYLSEKMRDGVFAATSAAVAAAVERPIEDEQAREVVLTAMAEDIRARLAAPPETTLAMDPVVDAAIADIAADRT